MSVAIRAITRLQDADDVNISLGAGVDEYALSWDNDTSKFVLRAVSSGSYLLATGATTGATSQAQAFTNGIIGPSWKPSADSTTALQLQNAAGASVLNVDTTNGRVGIGTAAPTVALDIAPTGVSPSFRVRAAPGYNATFALLDGDVSHPFSALLDAGVFMQTAPSSSTAGGAQFIGVSASASTPAATIMGYIGSAVPTAAAVTLNAYRSNGSTSRTALTGTQRVLDVVNGTTTLATVLASGNFGIGTTAPDTLLHANLASATTNAVTNILTLGHDTSGTAANGFGAGQLFTLESSTTAAQNAARIQALWNDATHATRKADLVLSAYDTAEREGLRIRGAGSAAAIGFLGATPAARIAHVADPTGGGTVDAEARSAINSILATLETFGFHATS